MRTIFALMICASLGSISTGGLAAQEPLSVPEALALRTIANPNMGLDFVAFNMVVPRPIEDGPGGSYLNVGYIENPRNALTGKPIETKWLVSGKNSAPALAVPPRQRAVSYLKRIKGKTQVVIHPLDGGDLSAYANTPSVISYRWRPDGQAMAFTALDPEPPQRADASKRGFRPIVYDEDWRHISLWIVTKNGSPRRLTSETTVYDYQWSPNGKTLVCACAPKNTVDASYMQKRLHLLDVESGKLEKLVSNPGKLGDFTFSPNGSTIFYISAATKNDPHAGSLWQVAAKAGAKPSYKSSGFLGMVQHLAMTDQGVAIQESVGVATRIVHVANDGSPQWLYQPKQQRLQITGLSFGASGAAFTASNANHPAELFMPAGKNRPNFLVRLTDSNPILKDRAFAEQRVLRLRMRDKVFVQGLLVLPMNYQEGTRYPMVIVAHGGPESHFSDGWLTTYSNWGHLLAARGIVSWYPNYRSSTGYGLAFAIHDHGDPMGSEFNDHLDAIKHFDEKGLIDPTRVGIGGGSYGGYTAAWAATKETEHFAAAVSFVPFVDIRTKWMTSDIPMEFYYVHYQEKWPWQQPELLTDRSPLTWAQQCDTPLLLLGGTKDPRVHPSQPHMLYRAVSYATDTPVRYVQYTGEGHGNRMNVNRMDYTLRTLRWFEHYLLGEGDRRAKALPALDVAYPK
ncbi:prolyl oligopeptidase family serine peptidase [bacterium]|nr:prolyl oligopeptidase family serine peptidase [bacterium]